MCVRSIYFTSFNDFSIGFRNCSGTVGFFSPFYNWLMSLLPQVKEEIVDKVRHIFPCNRSPTTTTPKNLLLISSCYMLCFMCNERKWYWKDILLLKGVKAPFHTRYWWNYFPSLFKLTHHLRNNYFIKYLK